MFDTLVHAKSDLLLLKPYIMSPKGPAGTYNDLKIIRNGIRKNLLPDEFVIADRGYSDSRRIQPPGHHHPRNRIYTKIRSRHEILNKRLKHCGVLAKRFRHKISFHSVCF